MQKLLIAFFCFSFLGASAQIVDRIEFREAKFKTGDDLLWASSFYNDDTWSTIKPGINWEPQGFDGYNGFAWYRIRFTLSSSIRENLFWKDSLRLFLARIDDADEIFLNGSIIAKNGSFPTDNKGYMTKWNETREIHLASTNPLLYWDKENLLAVRVYDGGGPGGIFSATPYVNMLDIVDGIRISVYFDQRNEKNNSLLLGNIFSIPISGRLNLSVVDTEKDSVLYSSSTAVTIPPNSSSTISLKIDPSRRIGVLTTFIEKNSGRSVSTTKINPYILTPASSPMPAINCASVFGVRPGSPFLFKIAATGEKPLQYSAVNLPVGLILDPKTGIIKGSVAKRGDYKLHFVVKNRLGIAKKEFIIKCGDLLALTPPMGWNSWNCWGLSVSDIKVRASAQALIDKGLADHGWTYMNIDDGWELSKRKDDGEIFANEKFPDMKALGDWLHSNGLKFGIYSSPGSLTCGGYLGSYQHEMQDATTYHNWGIDYLKYDWCSYENIHGGKDSSLASYKKPYELMGQVLRKQPRDIVYSLCQYGMKSVWQWGNEVDGNCWRTTGDIEDSWESLKNIGFSQNKQWPFAKPGRWNDPDMLIVGDVGWGENLHPSRLTPDEQYTHISLWCLLSAPLLIGCDISKMDDFTLSLLTNDEVIALNQDRLGRQAKQVIKKDAYQVWVKELSDGNKAIGIFNLTEEYQSVHLTWPELLLSGKLKIRDCWRQKDLGKFDFYDCKIPPHGVSLVKISK